MHNKALPQYILEDNQVLVLHVTYRDQSLHLRLLVKSIFSFDFVQCGSYFTHGVPLCSDLYGF